MTALLCLLLLGHTSPPAGQAWLYSASLHGAALVTVPVQMAQLKVPQVLP